MRVTAALMRSLAPFDNNMDEKRRKQRERILHSVVKKKQKTTPLLLDAP